jgi:hypothetical protein
MVHSILAHLRHSQLLGQVLVQGEARINEIVVEKLRQITGTDFSRQEEESELVQLLRSGGGVQQQDRELGLFKLFYELNSSFDQQNEENRIHISNQFVSRGWIDVLAFRLGALPENTPMDQLFLLQIFLGKLITYSTDGSEKLSRTLEYLSRHNLASKFVALGDKDEKFVVEQLIGLIKYKVKDLNKIIKSKDLTRTLNEIFDYSKAENSAIKNKLKAFIGLLDPDFGFSNLILVVQKLLWFAKQGVSQIAKLNESNAFDPLFELFDNMAGIYIFSGFSFGIVNSDHLSFQQLVRRHSFVTLKLLKMIVEIICIRLRYLHEINHKIPDRQDITSGPEVYENTNYISHCMNIISTQVSPSNHVSEHIRAGLTGKILKSVKIIGLLARNKKILYQLAYNCLSHSDAVQSFRMLHAFIQSTNKLTDFGSLNDILFHNSEKEGNEEGEVPVSLLSYTATPFSLYGYGLKQKNEQIYSALLARALRLENCEINDMFLEVTRCLVITHDMKITQGVHSSMDRTLSIPEMKTNFSQFNFTISLLNAICKDHVFKSFSIEHSICNKVTELFKSHSEQTTLAEHFKRTNLLDFFEFCRTMFSRAYGLYSTFGAKIQKDYLIEDLPPESLMQSMIQTLNVYIHSEVSSILQCNKALDSEALKILIVWCRVLGALSESLLGQNILLYTDYSSVVKKKGKPITELAPIVLLISLYSASGEGTSRTTDQFKTLLMGLLEIIGNLMYNSLDKCYYKSKLRLRIIERLVLGNEEEGEGSIFNKLNALVKKEGDALSLKKLLKYFKETTQVMDSKQQQDISEFGARQSVSLLLKLDILLEEYSACKQSNDLERNHTLGMPRDFQDRYKLYLETRRKKEVETKEMFVANVLERTPTSCDIYSLMRFSVYKFNERYSEVFLPEDHHSKIWMKTHVSKEEIHSTSQASTREAPLMTQEPLLNRVWELCSSKAGIESSDPEKTDLTLAGKNPLGKEAPELEYRLIESKTYMPPVEQVQYQPKTSTFSQNNSAQNSQNLRMMGSRNPSKHVDEFQGANPNPNIGVSTTALKNEVQTAQVSQFQHPGNPSVGNGRKEAYPEPSTRYQQPPNYVLHHEEPRRDTMEQARMSQPQYHGMIAREDPGMMNMARYPEPSSFGYYQYPGTAAPQSDTYLSYYNPNLPLQQVYQQQSMHHMQNPYHTQPMPGRPAELYQPPVHYPHDTMHIEQSYQTQPKKPEYNDLLSHIKKWKTQSDNSNQPN